MEARSLDEGRRGEAGPQRQVLGQEAEPRRSRVQDHPDTAAEIQAYKTGQVAGIYPQVQLELRDGEDPPDTSFNVTPGFSYEAIWFNTSKAPLNSPAVRQAIAYATDRKAIVDRLFGPISKAIQPLESFTTPRNKTYYTKSFSQYVKNLDKVNTLMTGDGWAKGSDGIWAKGGQKASLTVRVDRRQQAAGAH